jgi:hypothetical protein
MNLLGRLNEVVKIRLAFLTKKEEFERDEQLKNVEREGEKN